MSSFDRRDFIRATAAAAALAPLLVPSTARAQVTDDPNAHVPSILWLKRGDHEARIYYGNPEGYRYVAWLLRDVRAGQTGLPDWRLLKLLSWMQAWLAAYGYHIRFDINSGLRTPRTNAGIEGAARASMHLPDSRGQFRAVDFRAASVSSQYLSRLAMLARQGGVGYYADRNFTHVDTGRMRNWVGR